jgi:hypothetical protein
LDSAEIIARLGAAGVGAALALAGANKVTAWKQWRENAARQHLWTAVTFAVPLLELALGAALVVLKPSPATLGLATLLLVVFTSFLAVQVMAKSEVPCACFGARSNKPPTSRDVVRNLLMIAVLFLSAALSQ